MPGIARAAAAVALGHLARGTSTIRTGAGGIRAFNPAPLARALEVYRMRCRPSQRHPRPRVMVGASVIVAPTDEEGSFLATSLQEAFVNLRRGQPGRLPPPVAGFHERLSPAEQALLD